MKRRAFLSSLALLPFAGSIAPAIAAPAPLPGAPYRAVNVAGDGRRVYVFFSFSCPACRNHHRAMREWSETLPSSIAFEFVPVVVADPDYVLAARAWYAARLAAPARLAQFTDAVYVQIHDYKRPVSDPEMWLSAASSARIPGFDEAWTKVSRRQIEQAATLLERYGITETPSMAIGGHFVITPDNVNGDGRLFIELANGLVSKQVREAL